MFAYVLFVVGLHGYESVVVLEKQWDFVKLLRFEYTSLFVHLSLVGSWSVHCVCCLLDTSVPQSSDGVPVDWYGRRYSGGLEIGNCSRDHRNVESGNPVRLVMKMAHDVATVQWLDRSWPRGFETQGQHGVYVDQRWRVSNALGNNVMLNLWPRFKW